MRKYYFAILILLILTLMTSCYEDGDAGINNFEQMEALEIGDIIQFGNHDWRVLALYDDTALIITENVIGSMPYYNYFFSDVTWEVSEIRSYLNGAFLDTFTQEERGRILPNVVQTLDNEWYWTRGGNDTIDYVFLLSIAEVVRYFGDSGQLANPEPPQHGIRQAKLSDEYNSMRVVFDEYGAETGWWLRSPGFDIDFSAGVIEDGVISIDGWPVNANGGIRPALLLDLN